MARPSRSYARAHVTQADPDQLEAALTREQPHFAICSRFVPALDTTMAWAILHPPGGAASEFCAGGTRTQRTAPSFDDLLALIDRAADQLDRCSPAP